MATERRLDHISYNDHWLDLSMAQKASVNELSRFDLEFVRASGKEKLAFTSLDNKYASINENV